MRPLIFGLLLTCFITTLAGPIHPAYSQEGEEVHSALRTLFNPRRAPEHRTMGLAQRTFLDLVEESRPKLEIAFVIDGTESMDGALEGVRSSLSDMMNDLDLYKKNDVAYQIVIYRDSGAASGEVSYPLGLNENAFTADRNAVVTAIQQLTTESGAPYFPELIDQGVHHALTELPWSDENETSRWIILFGDAPPFDPSLNEEVTGAARRFATDTLVALAASKGVRINCVLCVSSEKDREAQAAVLDRTRAFMNALSSSSGGLMLDLSYEDIRSAMIEADAIRDADYSSVGTISREEVEKARAAAIQANDTSGPPVALAVLPHAPLEQASFSSSAAGARLSAELRLRFKSIPGVKITEPLVVERRLERLLRNPSYAGLRGTALLQALARSVKADYVLWGDMKHDSSPQRASTVVYDAATGDVVAQAERATSDAIGVDRLGSLLAGDVISAQVSGPEHRALAVRFASAKNDEGRRQSVTRLIANSRAHQDLVGGLADLERALAYRVGDTEGVQLLKQAQKQLKTASETDDTNALPRFLLAQSLYNLAKQEEANGGDSTALMKQFGRELRAAYRFRDTLKDANLQQEIEADYALLVRGRPEEAIPLYLELADGQGFSDAARRANWMLAGVYGGDWGVDENHVSQEKAKARIIQVLALWPESNEARFIRRVLRWDDERGETKFQHFPKENESLASQVDREV